MFKILVALDIFNYSKSGHSNTVRLFQEKQESASILSNNLFIFIAFFYYIIYLYSLFIDGWMYATLLCTTDDYVNDLSHFICIL